MSNVRACMDILKYQRAGHALMYLHGSIHAWMHERMRLLLDLFDISINLAKGGWDEL